MVIVVSILSEDALPALPPFLSMYCILFIYAGQVGSIQQLHRLAILYIKSLGAYQNIKVPPGHQDRNNVRNELFLYN